MIYDNFASYTIRSSKTMVYSDLTSPTFIRWRRTDIANLQWNHSQAGWLSLGAKLSLSPTPTGNLRQPIYTKSARISGYTARIAGIASSQHTVTSFSCQTNFISNSFYKSPREIRTQFRKLQFCAWSPKLYIKAWTQFFSAENKHC